MKDSVPGQKEQIEIEVVLKLLKKEAEETKKVFPAVIDALLEVMEQLIQERATFIARLGANAAASEAKP